MSALVEIGYGDYGPGMLVKGYSKAAVAKNVRILVIEGKTHKVAAAIAKNVAQKEVAKRGLKWTKTRDADYAAGVKRGFKGTSEPAKKVRAAHHLRLFMTKVKRLIWWPRSPASSPVSLATTSSRLPSPPARGAPAGRILSGVPRVCNLAVRGSRGQIVRTRRSTAERTLGV